MKIGFVSFDHLRDWHGTTRLIDQIAAEMGARGHGVVLVAHEGKASRKTPVSLREYPHELVTVELKTASGRRAAREKIAASGMDVCVASVNDRQLMYIPWLFRGSGIPYILGDPNDPRVFTFRAWQPYESYGSFYSADAIQTLLPEYIPFYPETLRPLITEIGIPVPPAAASGLIGKRRDNETRVIIWVGRLNEVNKRCSLLLRAFALLREDFPDWRLKLVGDGPYWEYYHVMAEQLGIKRYVDFTGAVGDPAKHYETADIFCLPSLFEGFPLVFAEAAAYALPLVCYETCTAAAVLLAPDMGILAESGTEGDVPESLAAALRRLMEASPEEREKLGLRACEVFQEKYGGGILYDKWEKLITETLEEARRAGETKLERICKLDSTEKEERMLHVGPDWDGLGPNSPLWKPGVLAAAAAEIAWRENPMESPALSTADAETENIRLRCELARLRENYGSLENKYNSLLAQFQAAAAGTAKGKKKRR